MSVSTTNVTLSYDASSNIIQTVAANEGLAGNSVTAPLTSAAVNPSAVAIGTSNQPLNAKPVNTANLQIGTATGQSLASWSNPA